MNSNTGSNLKKIQRDKIMINLSLIKFDRFSKPNGNFQDSTNGHLIKISFKDSLINENLKFKNLFEIIFKNINELLITKSKQIKSLNQTEKQQQQPLKQEDNSDSAIIKKNRNQLKMIYLILVNMIMILSLNNKNHNKMKKKIQRLHQKKMKQLDLMIY